MVPVPPLNLNLGVDLARYSQGAELHPEQCKPCAWFWKKAGGGGCDSGAACVFCHMCEEGALKMRKKEKAMRARKERKAQAEAAPSIQGYKTSGESVEDTAERTSTSEQTAMLEPQPNAASSPVTISLSGSVPWPLQCSTYQ